ncbi:MAG: hypothetical protein AAF899_14075 [Pseudomonadota bacterium]
MDDAAAPGTAREAPPTSEVPPTIGTFWTGPRLRDLDHLCIRSWLAQGHSVKFYSYEAVANVPPGVELCDARDVMDPATIRERAPELAKKPFTQANLFRLAMLMKGEAVWCDGDLALLRPLPPFRDLLLGREKNGKLCNAILWFRPDHPLMPTVIDAFLARSMPPWSYAKPRWRRLISRLTGKGANLDDYPKHQWGRHPLEYFVAREGLADQVKDWKAFYYPVIYDNWLYEPNAFDHIVNDPAVSGLHIFRKRMPPRNAAPGSFVAWLFDTYGDTLDAEGRGA